MKKRLMAGLVASAAIAMFAIPSMGQADSLVDHAVEAECTGTTAADGSGSCTATFPFSEKGFVSILDTHGNFHAPIILPPGAVSLEWIDAGGNSIYKASCLAPGLSLDGVGPFDIQSVTCTGPGTTTAEAVSGTQTLVVTASGGGAADVTFHGKIAISADGSLI